MHGQENMSTHSTYLFRVRMSWTLVCNDSLEFEQVQDLLCGQALGWIVADALVHHLSVKAIAPLGKLRSLSAQYLQNTCIIML